jgi:hypothetical protein
MPSDSHPAGDPRRPQTTDALGDRVIGLPTCVTVVDGINGGPDEIRVLRRGDGRWFVGDPSDDYRHSLLIRTDGEILKYLRAKQLRPGLLPDGHPCGRYFDVGSYAVRITAADALTWFEKHGLTPPEDLERGAALPSPSIPQQTRLRLDAEREVAILDGQPHSVGEDAIIMLGVLLDRLGGWVAGKELHRKPHDLVRPDRTLRGMPRAIKRLVESNTKRGYRITVFDTSPMA